MRPISGNLRPISGFLRPIGGLHVREVYSKRLEALEILYKCSCSLSLLARAELLPTHLGGFGNHKPRLYKLASRDQEIQTRILIPGAHLEWVLLGYHIYLPGQVCMVLGRLVARATKTQVKLAPYIVLSGTGILASDLSGAPRIYEIYIIDI